jgi:hypothetical protein
MYFLDVGVHVDFFNIQEYLDYRGYCCEEKYRSNRIRDNGDK